MAEDWLEEIYQSAQIITKLKEMCRLLHVGYDVKAFEIWNRSAPDIQKICGQYENLSKGAGSFMMRCAKEIAGAVSDMIVFADRTEELLILQMQEYLKALGHIRAKDDGFVIESSVAGYLALRDVKNNYVIHGLFDPMEDARVMAEYLYRPECDEYCILGSGFGYLAYQLYLVSEGSARIRVYELDKRMQDYGRHYGVLNWIPKENLYVEEDTDIMKFWDYTGKHDTGVIISEWVLPSVPAGERAHLEKRMGSA